MGHTRLIAEGRRLMKPDDRQLADHDKSMTVAGDIYTYATPSGSELEVLFARVWCKAPWKFRLIAVDLATARMLASTVIETEKEGRERLERELREQLLIA